ncbi:trans-aconitate methyltransferase 1 [Marasmius tenuissimus]|uniref:Trans-aconitate methyltransferase 1 n=1 Tax=Marasmius tenuissimus TaxID=585030 RepID=A0ABR3ADS8_9AGAR|nr:trans-aconitate methyltransferase 1 [Marasmius tenuissimus]
MATFAKTTFDASVYAASRPTYPKALFDLIFKYHQNGVCLPGRPVPELARQGKARFDTAVDLGCGTGQATVALTPFKRIIGVEPSGGMVAKAKKQLQEQHGVGDNSAVFSQIEFVQSSAEELGFLKDESADLVIAAQAAHWFNWPKLWPELSRVLRPYGTVAFWVYSDYRLPKYPSFTPLITEYAQGSDPDNSLGPHWQQPGRSILQNHLHDIPEPKNVSGSESSFTDLDRIYFTGSYYPDLPASQTLPVILRSKTTWNGLLGYLDTFSSLHTYLEHHPEDSKREDGNIAVRFWRSLMERAAQIDGKAESRGEDEVTVEWPVALVLTKKLP